MVKNLIFFYILFFFPLLAAETSLKAFIDPDQKLANQLIEVKLVLTHSSEEKIDSHSFKIGNVPFSPLFIKTILASKELNIETTLYSFTIANQLKGFNLLPAIEVKMGDKLYRSVPLAYEINNTPDLVPKPSSSKKNKQENLISSSFIFRLEAEIQGPTLLYPGQRTKLIYRILYNENLDLTQSQLPFVHAADFIKIGDVHVEDRQEGETTIQELTQEIEASKEGIFSLGPSFIEGYVYQLNNLGQKIYDPTLLRAEVPAVKIEVKPFPSPSFSSFTGGLGVLQIEAELKNFQKVKVGDTVDLILTLKGLSNLKDLNLPPLQCQPGFSGFFQLSDLPPVTEMKGESKKFTLSIRPLNSFIQEVPSIFLTSFDPLTATYITSQTSPLPLTVLPSSPPQTEMTLDFLKVAKWPLPPLFSLRLREKPSLSPYFFSLQTSWKGWILLLTFIGLLIGSRPFKSYQKNQRIKEKSEIFILEAEKNRQVKFLEYALWWSLWEKKLLPLGITDLSQVSLSNFYQLIFELQKIQYTSQAHYNFSNLLKQTQQLLTNNKDSL